MDFILHLRDRKFLRMIPHDDIVAEAVKFQNFRTFFKQMLICTWTFLFNLFWVFFQFTKMNQIVQSIS